MSRRIRTIKPEWLDDELLALASSDARVLSVALILLADDYGNGRASKLILGGQVFPGKPIEIVIAALAELVAIRYISIYSVDGQSYYSIRNWSKHQRVDKPGKNMVPMPSQGTDLVTVTEEGKIPASRGSISLPDPGPDLTTDSGDTKSVANSVADPIDPPKASNRKHITAFENSFKPPASKDPKVLQVHAAWQKATGRPDVFTHTYDNDADCISRAIDAYGLENTMLVAKFCMEDGMVSGKTDEKGQTHEHMAYVFGNTNAFGRILKRARKKIEQMTTETAAERVAKAKLL